MKGGLFLNSITGIGKRIKAACKKSGISQKEVGIKAGIKSARTMSYYVNEEQSPTIETLWKIAHITGVDLCWIITGKNLIELEDDEMTIIETYRAATKRKLMDHESSDEKQSHCVSTEKKEKGTA